MSFIDVNVSCEISPEKEEVIKSKLGQMICVLPGKNEAGLMVNFKDNCRLWLGGTHEPAAFITLMLYGTTTAENSRCVSDKIMEIIGDELGIDTKRIYVKIEEVSNLYRN